MTETTTTKKRELKGADYPILISKNGVSSISYLNIRKTLIQIENQRSKSSSVSTIVRITSILNRKNINTVYKELGDVTEKDYNLFTQLGNLWWDLYSEIPDASNDSNYGDLKSALSMGSSLACSLHIYLHKLYDHSRYSISKQVPLNLVGQLVRFEDMYDRWLQSTRKAAKNADGQLLEDIFGEIQFQGYGEFAELIAAIASMSWENRGYKSIGLRACQLSRKISFLLASTIYLRARMVRTSSRNGLKKIATSRTKLRRRIPNVQLGLKGVKGLKKFTHLTISTYIKDLKWIEQGNKPYSFATEIEDNYTVRLYYKSMNRSGITPETWIWTKGKTEGTSKAPYVVSELEGAGAYQGTHWEDYLATELNDAYNLYPGSLHMEWEFPVLGKVGAINDLLGRIKK